MRVLILAATAMLLGSGMAYGQSCTADGSLTDSVTSVSPGGGLCSATDQIATTCAGGTSLAAAPDAIYQVQIGATSSAVFSLQGTGFNPYIALMSGARGRDSMIPAPQGSRMQAPVGTRLRCRPLPVFQRVPISWWQLMPRLL